MELSHVMLDIETLGTGTNACIASKVALELLAKQASG